MNYSEYYIIKYRKRDGTKGYFGPFDIEEDAVDQMKKIQNRHNFARDITWAHLHRKMDVVTMTWAGS